MRPGSVIAVHVSEVFVNLFLCKYFLQIAPFADLSNVFLVGHSAGAHLVSLLALQPSFLMAAGISPSQFRGVVCLSGLYTLEQPAAGTHPKLVEYLNLSNINCTCIALTPAR